MPAIKACLSDPIGGQFSALLPRRAVAHPFGCHRPRVPGRVGFDKLVQVQVFDGAYWRIADVTWSATTLRRRDEWIAAGVMERLHTLVLNANDRMIGLELAEVVVDGCSIEAPCGGEVAGRNPVDRGKQGFNRSRGMDGNGIPLGAVVATANRPDSPLLEPTLATLERVGPLPRAMTVHLDRGYDSAVTRQRLAARGLGAAIAEQGKPAPLTAGNRWVMARTNAWTNADKKLVWCTERRARVVDFRLAFDSDHHRGTAASPRLNPLPLGDATPASPVKGQL